MELVAGYLKTQNKIHPLLKRFFDDLNIPPYQRKILEHLEEEKKRKRPLYFPPLFTRGSGKTNAQLGYMQSILEQRLEREEIIQPLRISPELQEHIDNSHDVIGHMRDALAQAMEREIHRNIFSYVENMPAGIINEHANVEFLNGSRITSYAHSDVSYRDGIRGQGVRLLFEPDESNNIPSIEEFQRYLNTGGLPQNGNGSRVPHDTD